MYKIVALVSYIYRSFYLPNPFINCFSDPNIAYIFNLSGASVIIGFLSFGITHLYYNSGECPALGSLSYLFWYILNTYIFIGIGKITSSLNMFIILTVIVYIAIACLVIYMKNIFSDRRLIKMI